MPWCHPHPTFQKIKISNSVWISEAPFNHFGRGKHACNLLKWSTIFIQCWKLYKKFPIAYIFNTPLNPFLLFYVCYESLCNLEWMPSNAVAHIWVEYGFLDNPVMPELGGGPALFQPGRADYPHLLLLAPLPASTGMMAMTYSYLDHIYTIY